MKLTNQERNTILAALRYYQDEGMCEPDNRSDDLHDIATNGNADISLDIEGVDALCVKLNLDYDNLEEEEEDAADALIAALMARPDPDDDQDEDWLDDTENADTLSDWRSEVAAGDTSRSYEDWLASRREQNADRRAYLAKQNR